MSKQKFGRVALVTGSSRGIGRGIALELAREGFNLALNGRNLGAAAEESLTLCKKEGVAAEFIPADISHSDSRSKLIDGVRKKFGRLDFLVNNAGVAPEQRRDLLEATEESFDRIIEINLKGPYFLTQLASKWMIGQSKTYPERDYGIVNISSISAYTSSPERANYCISKAGISMLTKLFADRLAQYGIYVYEIRPGIISTDMTESVKDKYTKLIKEEGINPIKRWGKPEDIGRAVVALAKGYYPYSTGEIFNIDGGFHLKRL